MTQATAEPFDVLIVGAGSAGCVLAARLSEDPACRVGVLEAGGPVEDPDIARPGMWPLLQGRSYDWGYETVPQPFTADRRHPWPRGRLLGGSSCLHAMAHVRGHPADFDAWARAGGQGWSFANLLPWFKRLERFSGGASDWHGADGPLEILLPTEGTSPLVHAFMEASRELGLPESGDHNGPRMRGAAPNSLTIRDGRRVTAWDAYLEPVRDRANLTVLTGLMVDRLPIERGRAAGVEIVEAGGARRTVGADRVVLAAGAVATPLILMRSGIGDPAELSRHGIPCLVDNPAVGDNLHDHLLGAGLVYRARRPVPPSNYQHSESLLYHGGPEDGPPRVVVACVVAPTVTECFERPPMGSAYTFLFGACKPSSRGRLALGGRDPRAAPVIDPAYLSAPEDRAAMRDALALARQLGGTRAMAEWREAELLPGPTLRTDDDDAVDAFVARASMTHHHPVGTCRMGPAGDGVVDGGLAVHGLERAWIADASVIPEITSGPVHAAVLALAEKASDLLRGR